MVITISPAGRNPYFNIVGFSPDGFVQLVIQSPMLIDRRQHAPLMHDVTKLLMQADRSSF